MTRPVSAAWGGYLLAVAAAALWGTSGIFAVNLFRLGMPPASVALLRPVVGALGLLAFAAFRPHALRVSGAGLTLLALGGGAAVGVFQVAYQRSTDAVGVPRTVALLYLAPALVVGASGPLLGEWPTRRRVALALITVAGVWLSVAGAEEVASVFGPGGIEWGLLAAASYATYTLFGRFAAPRYGALATVVYSTAGACVVLALALPALAEPIVLPPSASAWALLVAFGLLTISAAQFLFFAALSRIEAAGASIATAVEPVVAAVLASVLVSQRLRPAGWAGLALVALGVAGVGWASLRERGARLSSPERKA